MRINFRLFITLVMCAGGIAAQEEHRGAKELFYDPVDRIAASVAATSSRPAGTEKPTKSRLPERRDDHGRRLVNFPPSEPEGPAVQTALGLSYWIELVGTEGDSGVQVTERRIFRSGDRIRLHFRSNAEGRIALIQLGSSGTSHFLFPDLAKGLSDSRLVANEERILPSPNHWFRFDDQPGTEKLLVLFARTQREIDSFQPPRPSMDDAATRSLIERASYVRGSKDLFVETEVQEASEIGTYGVNVAGQPVVLEISLEHQ